MPVGRERYASLSPHEQRIVDKLAAYSSSHPEHAVLDRRQPLHDVYLALLFAAFHHYC